MSSLVESRVLVRQMEEHERGIIFSTMPRGMYYSNIKPITQSKKEWFAWCFEYINGLLSRGVVPRVAVLEGSPSTILGYMVHEGSTLHWIYVKEAFRRQGIATLLVKGVTLTQFPNRTKVGQSILQSKNREVADEQETLSAD